MAIYYHLSNQDNLNEIVQNSEDSEEGQIFPRIPDQCHGEDQTPRVCISPTVWQCILSKPLKNDSDDLLYIYELDVEKSTDPKGTIADIKSTDEKWITNEDLIRIGNSIKLNIKGKVISNKEVKLILNRLNRQGRLPKDKSEQEIVWGTESEVWKLKIN